MNKLVSRGPKEFSVSLPRDAAIIERGNGKRQLLMETPNAAEIIIAIAETEDFGGKDHEKKILSEIARRIAERFSGHPKI